MYCSIQEPGIFEDDPHEGGSTRAAFFFFFFRFFFFLGASASPSASDSSSSGGGPLRNRMGTSVVADLGATGLFGAEARTDAVVGIVGESGLDAARIQPEH